MDRNALKWNGCLTYAKVATREGGVDRNVGKKKTQDKEAQSPPARVAWIETYLPCTPACCLSSPPARVAWIETMADIYKKDEKGRRHPRGWRG